jgi:hypothetical protein
MKFIGIFMDNSERSIIDCMPHGSEKRQRVGSDGVMRGQGKRI